MTEETGAHDREGYSRIPEDGTCNFTIQIDDNGYLEINGEKVVELTGCTHSSTSASGSKELKKGFHYAKLHHENLPYRRQLPLIPMRRGVPKMGDSERELWEIDAPKNPRNLGILPMHQRLPGCCNVVDYPTMATDDVWNYIGGRLKDSHVLGDTNFFRTLRQRSIRDGHRG